MRTVDLTILVAFCSLAGTAFAQRIETIVPGVGGRVAVDAAGRPFAAQSTPRSGATDRDIRVRNFTLEPAGFDVSIGGSGDEDLTAMVLGSDGTIFVLGTTSSRDLPSAPGVLWPAAVAPEQPSAFLTRLDRSGRILSTTYIGVPGLALQARALTFSPDGSLLLGFEVSGSGMLKFDGIGIVGEGALLVLRTDAGVTRVLGGKRLGGVSPCRETLAAIQTDSDGAVFLAGTSCSDDFPVTSGAFLGRKPSGNCTAAGPQGGSFPCRSGVIARLDSGLNLRAATYLGGAASASVRDLAVDREGYPYVTGTAEMFPAGDRESFPTTPGAYQEVAASRTQVVSPQSVFVTKLKPDLSGLVYSTLLNGSRSENPSSILVDEAGRAVVAGGTVSPDFPATGAFRTPCGPVRGLNPPESGFIARLAADGRTLNSSARIPESYLRASALNLNFVLAAADDYVTLLDFNSGDAPSVACVVNGMSLQPERVLAPNQVVTFLGSNFSPETEVRFDLVPARLLYASSTQLNVVVPAELSGQDHVLATLSTNGIVSNTRPFALSNTHPALKVFVGEDSRLVV